MRTLVQRLLKVLSTSTLATHWACSSTFRLERSMCHLLISITSVFTSNRIFIEDPLTVGHALCIKLSWVATIAISRATILHDFLMASFTFILRPHTQENLNIFGFSLFNCGFDLAFRNSFSWASCLWIILLLMMVITSGCCWKLQTRRCSFNGSCSLGTLLSWMKSSLTLNMMILVTFWNLNAIAMKNLTRLNGGSCRSSWAWLLHNEVTVHIVGLLLWWCRWRKNKVWLRIGKQLILVALYVQIWIFWIHLEIVCVYECYVLLRVLFIDD